MTWMIKRTRSKVDNRWSWTFYVNRRCVAMSIKSYRTKPELDRALQVIARLLAFHVGKL